MDQPLIIALTTTAQQRLSRIAADMGRTPESLAAAILSEWALIISQNLDHGIRRPTSRSQPDFIHLGLLVPGKGKEEDQ